MTTPDIHPALKDTFIPLPAGWQVETVVEALGTTWQLAAAEIKAVCDDTSGELPLAS